MSSWILKQLNHSITPKKAIAFWDGDYESLQLVNDGINVVYRFAINNQGYYLRITHPSIRNHQELTSAIDYQNFLFLHDAPVCHPIKSKNNNYIETVHQENLTFYAHVCNELPGKTIDLKHDKKEIFHTWGKSLAMLHNAATSYKPCQNYHFLTWKDLWQEIQQAVQNEDKFIQQAYLEVNEFLQQLEKTPDNFGLTHGDQRGANALYHLGKAYIIDFDEPVYHWFMSDIACAFLGPEPLNIWQDKLYIFLDGYNSIRNITTTDMSNIVWFMRMKNLGLYTWTKNHWHQPEVPGGSETNAWLHNLYISIINPITLSNI